MSTNATGTKESIDKRTRKAATESMTVVALDEAGEYKVYSGTRNAYVVDLITETCECPDEEYNHPADGCKHRQRVEMETGQREIPNLGGRLDVEIMSGREADEARVATDGGRSKCVECGGYLPDEIEAGTGVYCPQCGAGQHITDGGAIVDANPQGSDDETTHAPGCDNPNCEGLGSEHDRPLLSFECWDEWAAYDEDEAVVRSVDEVNI